MSYFGHNDPANPSHLNPDGSSNQAYFARQEEERRRREAEEAEKKRRQEEADRFQREQSERFEEEARKHHRRTIEEQQRSQAEWIAASSSTNSYSYASSYSSSTPSGSSAQNKDGGLAPVLVVGSVLVAVFVVVVYIPYQLGLAVGVERATLIGRWSWWGVLGFGLGGAIIAGAATVWLATQLERTRDIEVVSKPGMAFVTLVAFLGTVAGVQLTLAVVTYFILVSFSLMLLTVAGVAVAKELLRAGRFPEQSSRDEEDWYTLLREVWAWLAIVFMTLLAIPLGVGVARAGGSISLTPRGSALVRELNSICQWPLVLGDKFVANAFHDANYWTAAGNLLTVMAIAVWWGMIAFALVSLISPRKGPSVITASIVGLSVVAAAVIAMCV